MCLNISIPYLDYTVANITVVTSTGGLWSVLRYYHGFALNENRSGIEFPFFPGSDTEIARKAVILLKMKSNLKNPQFSSSYFDLDKFQIPSWNLQALRIPNSRELKP